MPGRMCCSRGMGLLIWRLSAAGLFYFPRGWGYYGICVGWTERERCFGRGDQEIGGCTWRYGEHGYLGVQEIRALGVARVSVGPELWRTAMKAFNDQAEQVLAL
ncbi:Pyruvate/Phosphoenolpyruvate kinase [Penicillium paradoxum]|uniref:Pyruvate/Phosphoenolpyruvate kinase n=1 Tax=Penicillium paradoxum TaxID=176176 RepID=UPI0025487F83|nr:Pyruvate/Phosphoenolpyruvate kinase [Penicillium paradoxum]KAJ5772960.1 Pyruvate/Phosphoenolpyruvate kinase [Penicillium paradoxum]